MLAEWLAVHTDDNVALLQLALGWAALLYGLHLEIVTIIIEGRNDASRAKMDAASLVVGLCVGDSEAGGQAQGHCQQDGVAQCVHVAFLCWSLLGSVSDFGLALRQAWLRLRPPPTLCRWSHGCALLLACQRPPNPPPPVPAASPGQVAGDLG